MRVWLRCWLGLMLLHGTAFATPLYSGAVEGNFSAPVLAGIGINTDGSTFLADNSATAIVAGVGTNEIVWGTCDSTCFVPPAPPAPPSSTVSFAGESFVGVAPETIFKLGTLRFTNGTSFSNTTIFAATLTLSVTGGAIEPAVTQIKILATINGNADVFADADFLSYDVLPFTFHVLEGATAVADLYGYIHGDPQLVLQSIRLPPEQAGGGFLAPAPGSVFLVTLALAGLGFARTFARGWRCASPPSSRVL